MSRFGDWRARRRTTSRRTVRAGRWRRGPRRAPPQPALAPDVDSHLSDGVVVETRLVARLLGVRRLKVDGVVLLAPARLGTPEPRPAALQVARGDDAQLGAGLAHASRLLDDCDRRLG